MKISDCTKCPCYYWGDGGFDQICSITGEQVKLGKYLSKGAREIKIPSNCPLLSTDIVLTLTGEKHESI